MLQRITSRQYSFTPPLNADAQQQAAEPANTNRVLLVVQNNGATYGRWRIGTPCDYSDGDFTLAPGEYTPPFYIVPKGQLYLASDNGQVTFSVLVESSNG